MTLIRVVPLLCLFSAAIALSQVTKNVSGSQSGTWTSDTIYVVIGNVTVPSGKSLTISPGTTVNFQSSYGLTVSSTASLTATGAYFVRSGSGTNTISWQATSTGTVTSCSFT